jgi:hypothetical protein
MQSIVPAALVAVIGLLSLPGCGSGGSAPAAQGTAPTYTVGGSIAGLSGTLVLNDNGHDTLSTSSNGTFNFTTALHTGAAYVVSITTQPSGQTCAVSMGTGTVSNANANTVGVSCVNSLRVTGVADWEGPVGAAVVTIKDSANRSATTTTASDGTFSIDVSNLTGPFLLSVSQGVQTQFGYAPSGGGVANLTPFTTAALSAYYLTSGTSTSAVFSATLSNASFPDPQQLQLIVSAVWSNVLPYLTAAGVVNAQAISPFSSAFAADHTGVNRLGRRPLQLSA